MTRRSASGELSPRPEACRGGAARFIVEQDGSITLINAAILSATLMTMGLALDVMRLEYQRTKLQSTCDTAVLAAASLTQSGQAEEVVEAYFDAHGVLPALQGVSSEESGIGNARIVSAEAADNVFATFLQLAGVDGFTASVDCEARESIPDLEISLVLDVSGSMNSKGQNTGQKRIDLLRPAASSFVDTVMPGKGSGTPLITSISIVPFASQVAVGPFLDGTFESSGNPYFNVTQEHRYATCVDFEDDDFDTVAISPSTPLQRAGHFETSTYSRPVSNENRRVCLTEQRSTIIPWSESPDDLKDRIQTLQPRNTTSVNIGAKWGAALLDPDMKSMMDDMIDRGERSDDLAQRPHDYTANDAMKVMVVMSDGQHVQHAVLKDEYRSGPSRVWIDHNETNPAVIADPSLDTNYGNDEYSLYMGKYWIDDEDWSPSEGWDSDWAEEISYSQLRKWTPSDTGGYTEDEAIDMWYHIDQGSKPSHLNAWRDHPDGYGGPQAPYEADFTEVFERMSVAWWSRYIMKEAEGGSNLTAYNKAFTQVSSKKKDDQLSRICEAARDAGIIVYTISFEAPKHGADTLRDCAGSDARFYHVTGVEISEAFGSIASQINMLRLTQ